MRWVVAIVGAGELGGTLAREVAARDVAAEIRLIDPNGSVAAGKALDIQQAGPVEQFTTRLSATDAVDAAAGSDIIVLADQVGTPAEEWHGEPGLALLRRISPGAGQIVICAGPRQRGLIDLSIRELGTNRRHIFGTAPAAWNAAIRARVALEIDMSPSDVSLMALGNPPTDAVITWSTSTAGGVSLESLLSPPALRRIDALASRLWPPGPYALATAAAAAIDSIVSGSRPMLCCLAGLSGEFGVRTGVAAVPVLLGRNGVERILEPQLSVQENVRLGNAMQKLT